MTERWQFSASEWADVATMLGNLDGVRIVDLDEDGFHFVGFLDWEVLEDLANAIQPATHEHVRLHLEARLAAVRAWGTAKNVVGRIGTDHAKIATAAQTLLDLLPEASDVATGLPSAVLHSKGLRSQLAQAAAYSSAIASDVDDMLANPSHRPTLPVPKVEYWSHLMRFWTDVLGKPATNSPYGPLAEFINAASAPAGGKADVLSASVDKAYEFVKKHRREVWQTGEKANVVTMSKNLGGKARMLK